MEKYAITVYVKEESESMAYQLLQLAIPKKYRCGDWQYKTGIYAPTDFEDVSGQKWKRK